MFPAYSHSRSLQDTYADAADVMRRRSDARYVCILSDHILHFSHVFCEK